MAEYGEELSHRELDVLRCIARGDSNKDAAAELHISENTVKVHLRRVFAKLGVSSRTEATRVAIQQGLVIVPGVEVEAASDTEAPAALEEELAAEPITDAQATTPASIAQLKPATPAAAAAPKRFPLWRTLSLVLAVLLVIAVVTFINLQLRAEDNPTIPEPFTQTALGEDWNVTNRPLPLDVADMAVVAVGLNVYAIGGETADTTLNTIYSFDAATHVWNNLTPKPTAVASASAAALFGEIYVVGGRLPDGQPTNIVEAYSPTQNAWRPITSLPQPVSGGVALSDGSFLYLFGGWNGTDYLDTVYLYDPAEDSWRPLASLSQPRSLATGQFLTGQLYVVGGFNGEEELNICEFFEPTLLEWFDCPPLLLARGGGASAAVLNKLYVIGGGLNGRQEIIYSERYDPVTQTWQVVNTPFLADTSVWTGLGVANVENRIFAFGGRRDGTLISDTYVYAPLYRTFLPSVPVEGN